MHQLTYPQNLVSPLISVTFLKMLENAKFSYVSRKKMLKYHYIWGDARADFFLTAGTRPPTLSTPKLQSRGDSATLLFCRAALQSPLSHTLTDMSVTGAATYNEPWRPRATPTD